MIALPEAISRLMTSSRAATVTARVACPKAHGKKAFYAYHNKEQGEGGVEKFAPPVRWAAAARTVVGLICRVAPASREGAAGADEGRGAPSRWTPSVVISVQASEPSCARGHRARDAGYNAPW